MQKKKKSKWMRLEWHVLVHIKLMANYSIRTRERKVSRKTANIALHDYWMKFLYICTKFPSNQRRANRIQHTIQIVPGDFLYNMYICQLDWYVIYQFTSVLQDSYASLFPPDSYLPWYWNEIKHSRWSEHSYLAAGELHFLLCILFALWVQ